jgi:hypothetical protein
MSPVLNLIPVLAYGWYRYLVEKKFLTLYAVLRIQIRIFWSDPEFFWERILG